MIAARSSTGLPAESQIKGGVVQGIGMAFTEELITDR